MGAIANLFGYLLNFLYNIFNNYGIAIIVFSVILRIILIPVTISQQKSIKKNEKMQEKMKETSQLELGAEIVQGTMEQMVTVQEGDDLQKLMNREILLEDGKILAIRE